MSTGSGSSARMPIGDAFTTTSYDSAPASAIVTSPSLSAFSRATSASVRAASLSRTASDATPAFTSA